ncbi:class I SAM-dependent methyltransferase [Heliophilum fasciatum]|uniref:class I SAM-dependent methyltransferase n=1 Tax=Heliophilum fasciatum TaxID=35700 RepID=UPI002226F2D7|nr:class I SAM-dependent methyltransferase [Heliophilum fasciatum]
MSELQSLAVTTSTEKAGLELQAAQVAQKLGIPFWPRDGKPLATIYEQAQCDWLLIREQHRWIIKGKGETFFFHPNMAKLRVKNLLQGQRDALIEAMAIRPGDQILDCTIGLGADAIVAQMAVGEKGVVVGIESNPLIAFIVAEGLRSGLGGFTPEVQDLMKRIAVYPGDHQRMLALLPKQSFDVVYFDPMFRAPNVHSSGLAGLRPWADMRPIAHTTIELARRVARRAVVIKERTVSKEWQRLQPERLLGSSYAPVQYGIWSAGGFSVR